MAISIRFPAIQAKMGRWKFYLVKMSMRELAVNVKFSTEINAEDMTLDVALQRTLEESRVTKDIVAYLSNNQDRFFSSIVVAAWKGNPKWIAVTIEDGEYKNLNGSFGVLEFDGSVDYYALDGQHRMSAIRELVIGDNRRDAPENFAQEEISVIIVVPSHLDSDDKFLVRYRRLFGHLNRYAKPTDKRTNIIMDEDDAFAIITRRLISNHEFFKYAGPVKDSPKIKTDKGKNLKKGDPYFTSLETLYDMNVILLTSRFRRNNGWNDENQDIKSFLRIRPSDEKIDELYNELELYWNALLAALPELKNDPVKMREHSPQERKNECKQDNALFWPIGQEILAGCARELMDDSSRLHTEKELKFEAVAEIFDQLNKVTWDLHKPPWRNLILISQDDEEKNWIIRSEERTKVVNLIKDILAWQLGIDQLESDEIERLRNGEKDKKTGEIKTRGWSHYLMLNPPKDKQDEMWQKIEDGVIR